MKRGRKTERKIIEWRVGAEPAASSADVVVEATGSSGIGGMGRGWAVVADGPAGDAQPGRQFGAAPVAPGLQQRQQGEQAPSGTRIDVVVHGAR